MDNSPYLIIERGTPFNEGTIISITNPILILGRKGENWNPDLTFDNAFVSRKHAALYSKNGNFFIKDLDSKHGTFLNNQPLIANKKVPLKHQDKISFAHNQVVLTYITQRLDETMDIKPFLSEIEKRSSASYQLNPIKQELAIDNRVYFFSEKEYKCIEFLIQNRGQFVSKEEIKERVWPERAYSAGLSPDVSQEELNALIYRIRKKAQDNLSIENIRGKGYVLTISKDAPY
jgi:two-component system, OmpR family, response regulator QseB